MIDDEKYVDDGTVYDIKRTKENIDEILDFKIDFKELNQKHNFLHEEKELILKASLEIESGEPDIAVLKQAIAIIERYESGYLINEQEHLKHVQQRDDAMTLSNDLHDEVWKMTLLALFLGPIGLLKLSWKFALAVALLSVGMFFTLPELLVSIPLLSSAIAWKIVNRKVDGLYYHKTKEKEAPLFRTQEEEEKSVISDYRVFLKKEKTVWLAAVLGFVFNGFGLFYVSWVFALGMFVFTIILYINFPVVLIAAPFISLGLGLYAAIETNSKIKYMNYSAGK